LGVGRHVVWEKIGQWCGARRKTGIKANQLEGISAYTAPIGSLSAWVLFCATYCSTLRMEEAYSYCASFVKAVCGLAIRKYVIACLSCTCSTNCASAHDSSLSVAERRRQVTWRQCRTLRHNTVDSSIGGSSQRRHGSTEEAIQNVSWSWTRFLRNAGKYLPNYISECGNFIYL
jgi:hypothetical protein